MVRDFFVLGPEVCIWFLLTSHWPAPGYLGIASCQGDWGPYPNSNPRRKREGENRSEDQPVHPYHTSTILALFLGDDLPSVHLNVLGDQAVHEAEL